MLDIVFRNIALFTQLFAGIWLGSILLSIIYTLRAEWKTADPHQLQTDLDLHCIQNRIYQGKQRVTFDFKVHVTKHFKCRCLTQFYVRSIFIYCKPNVYCRRPGPCHMLN